MYKNKNKQYKLFIFLCYNIVGDNMEKKQYEELLNILLSTGAEFAEIYYEEASSKSYEYNDSKLDSIKTGNTKGIGFRIIYNGDYFYSSSNNLDYENLKVMAERLSKNVISNNNCIVVRLDELENKTTNVKINHSEFPTSKKKSILSNINKLIRDKFAEITQVYLRFIENDKIFTIANSKGKFVTSNAVRTRYICHTYAEKDGIKEDEYFAIGRRKGYDFLEDFDIELESLKVAESNVEKLSAVEFKGGEMPVVIGAGFGAVIFHEACGHGLEATSVAPGLSIFTGQIGNKVGTEKVTLIDDGTIPDAWGSNTIDDEGELPRKNILIEKGILKQYLVDIYSNIQMKTESNGCGKRESYEYAPTSRMSNTYLAPGNDSLDDMIKSIEHGVYCKKLSGGQVNTTTGDFNFGVDAAYAIENGKITKRIKGVTLIGNGKDILNEVEMVGSDLELGDGYCGSKSGMVPVTCGQPSIKISKILVGGKE